MLKLCLFENKLNLCGTLYFLSATPDVIPKISVLPFLHSHSLATYSLASPPVSPPKQISQESAVTSMWPNPLDIFLLLDLLAPLSVSFSRPLKDSSSFSCHWNLEFSHDWPFSLTLNVLPYSSFLNNSRVLRLLLSVLPSPFLLPFLS